MAWVVIVVLDHPEGATFHEAVAENHRSTRVVGVVQIVLQSLELGGSKLYASSHGGDIDTTKQLLDQSEALWPVVVMGSIFATMMLPICLAVIMASSSVCRDSGRAVLKAATRKL